jgi:DNA-directed RNA polymerase specialized sigma subunit
MLVMVFVTGSVTPAPRLYAREAGATVAESMTLPDPRTLIQPAGEFQPVTIQGIRFYPEDPLRLDFVISKGGQPLQNDALKRTSGRLIKYFLASLTVPDQDKWVNLSPDEKDRIIPKKFGATDMGRDLLAQDYVLKQLTSSLMFPEDDLGTVFWDKVYAEARARLGTTDVPLDAFNKVWIVPSQAEVYEHENGAFVVKSKLKVLTEQDYRAFRGKRIDGRQARVPQRHTLTAQVIKEIIVPALEKEVNHGRHFARLRQMYHADILAAWFKRRIRESVLARSYVGRNLTHGIESKDPAVKDQIYQRYLKAFTQGVYDYIKEEYDPVAREVVSRKYFSGGAGFEQVDAILKVSRGSETAAGLDVDEAMVVEVGLNGQYQGSSDDARAAAASQESAAPESKVTKAFRSAIVRMRQEEPEQYRALLAFIEEEMDLTVDSPDKAFDALQTLFNFISYGEYLGVNRETVKKIVKANQMRMFTINIGGKKDVYVISPKSIAKMDAKRAAVLRDAERQYQAHYGEAITLRSPQDLAAWYSRKGFLEAFPLITPELFDAMADKIWAYRVRVPNIGFNHRQKYIPPVEIERLKPMVLRVMRSERNMAFLRTYGYVNADLLPEELDFPTAAGLVEAVKQDALKVADVEAEKGHSKRLIAQKIRDAEVDHIDLNFFGKRPDYYVPVAALDPVEGVAETNLQEAKAFLEERCGVPVPSLDAVKDLLAQHAVSHKEFVNMLGAIRVPGFREFENTVPLRVESLQKPTAYMPRREAEAIVEAEEKKFTARKAQVVTAAGVPGLATKKDVFSFLRKNWLTVGGLLRHSDYEIRKSLMNAIARGRYTSVTWDLLGFGRKRTFIRPDIQTYLLSEQRRGIEALFLAVFSKKLFNHVEGFNQEGVGFASEIIAQYLSLVPERIRHSFAWEETDPDHLRQWQVLIQEDLVQSIIHRLDREVAAKPRDIIERLSAMWGAVEKAHGPQKLPHVDKWKIMGLKNILERVLRHYQVMYASQHKSRDRFQAHPRAYAVAAHLLRKRNLLMAEGISEDVMASLLAAAPFMNHDGGAHRVLVVVNHPEQARRWQQTALHSLSSKIVFADMTETAPFSFARRVEHIRRQNQRFVIITDRELRAHLEEVKQLYADYVIVDDSRHVSNAMLLPAYESLLRQLDPRYRAVISTPFEWENQTQVSYQTLSWLAGEHRDLVARVLDAENVSEMPNYPFFYEHLMVEPQQPDQGPLFPAGDNGTGIYQSLVNDLNAVFFSSPYAFEDISQQVMLIDDPSFTSAAAKEFKKQMSLLERGPAEFEAAFAILEQKTERYLGRVLEQKMLALFQDELNGYAFDFLVKNFQGYAISRVNAKINLNPKLAGLKKDLIQEAAFGMMYGLYKFDRQDFGHLRITTYLKGWIDNCIERSLLKLQEGGLAVPVHWDAKRKYLWSLTHEIKAATGKIPVDYETFEQHEKAKGVDFEQKISPEAFQLFMELSSMYVVNLDAGARPQKDDGGAPMRNSNLISVEDFQEKPEMTEQEEIEQKDFMAKLFVRIAGMPSLKKAKDPKRDLRILGYLFGYDVEGQRVMAETLTLREVGEIYRISRERVRQIAVRYERGVAVILRDMGFDRQAVQDILSVLRTRKRPRTQDGAEDFAAVTEKDLGGIDLRANPLVIRSGQEQTRAQFQRMVGQLDRLQGFKPVILNIHPVVNPQALLGM